MLDYFVCVPVHMVYGTLIEGFVKGAEINCRSEFEWSDISIKGAQIF